MCTAVFYKDGNAYFGRNLDLAYGFSEKVVVMPRFFPVTLRCEDTLKEHFAMVGMSAIVNGFPLFFDGTNEKGLSMAGLNFAGNATYYEFSKDKFNVAPFELIPWVLGRCESVQDAKALILKTNVIRLDFSKELPLTPLHWMISDKNQSIVLETLADGVKIHDNPFGVLTNNPTFEFHRMNMNNFMGLTCKELESGFDEKLPLENYSLGLGAMGLPGDFSSASRFVRAVFVKENSVKAESEKARVNQFFHILSAVSMPKGCVLTKDGFEYTRYSSCCNAEDGIYYYRTYDEYEIKSVRIGDYNIDGDKLYF